MTAKRDGVVTPATRPASGVIFHGRLKKASKKETHILVNTAAAKII